MNNMRLVPALRYLQRMLIISRNSIPLSSAQRYTIKYIKVFTLFSRFSFTLNDLKSEIVFKNYIPALLIVTGTYFSSISNLLTLLNSADIRPSSTLKVFFLGMIVSLHGSGVTLTVPEDKIPPPDDIRKTTFKSLKNPTRMCIKQVDSCITSCYICYMTNCVL